MHCRETASHLPPPAGGAGGGGGAIDLVFFASLPDKIRGKYGSDLVPEDKYSSIARKRLSQYPASRLLISSFVRFSILRMAFCGPHVYILK